MKIFPFFSYGNRGARFAGRIERARKILGTVLVQIVREIES